VDLEIARGGGGGGEGAGGGGGRELRRAWLISLAGGRVQSPIRFDFGGGINAETSRDDKIDALERTSNRYFQRPLAGCRADETADRRGGDARLAQEGSRRARRDEGATTQVFGCWR